MVEPSLRLWQPAPQPQAAGLWDPRRRRRDPTIPLAPRTLAAGMETRPTSPRLGRYATPYLHNDG